MNIKSFKDLTKLKQDLVNRMLSSFTHPASWAQQEVENILDHTLQYCHEQKKIGVNIDEPSFFLSVFSDFLYVTPESLRQVFKNQDIHFPEDLDITNSIQALTKQLDHSENPQIRDTIAQYLPDYHISAQEFEHPLFKNRCISCYPQEKHVKVTLGERLSQNYVLPEKRAKYARPILDLEIISDPAGDMPYVRCYLTLTDRPRPGGKDKDITQNQEGAILFSNVTLLNFSDPLRALTWVEDYTKNKDHQFKGPPNPIIRTFLLPLSEYVGIIQSAVGVDSDRAPGQVKQLNTVKLHPLKNSLTSFMNQSSLSIDGQVQSLENFSAYVLGQPIHPKNLTRDSTIAHQHGRPVEGSSDRYYSTTLEPMVLARTLERDLAGFGLQPTSKLSIESFLKNTTKKNTKLKCSDPSHRNNSSRFT